MRESGWRYLEAAPYEFTKVQWGVARVNGTKTGLGDGKRNTELIVAALESKGEGSRAAQLVRAYDGGGYTDWYLPSLDELDLMYRNLKIKGLGGFSSDKYWSSSGDGDLVQPINFSNGSHPTTFRDRYTTNAYSVRSIRQF